MQLHRYRYLYEPYSYDTPLIHIWIVALKSSFRAYVEIKEAVSGDDGTKDGRPFRAAHVAIYLYAGRGVTPQKLLGETPKAFGECPTVIRL